MPFTLPSPPSLPGLQPQRTKDPLREEWGCHKPGRDLGNLVRERGPHDESEKDLGFYRRPFPTGANLEQTWEGQSTALYFAKAVAQREVMTILQSLRTRDPSRCACLARSIDTLGGHLLLAQCHHLHGRMDLVGGGGASLVLTNEHSWHLDPEDPEIHRRAGPKYQYYPLRNSKKLTLELKQSQKQGPISSMSLGIP